MGETSKTSTSPSSPDTGKSTFLPASVGSPSDCGSPTSPTPSASSPEDSPARTLAGPDEGQGSTGTGQVFGERSPTPFATYDPASSSWRTPQASLFEECPSSLETWPRSGMTRNG